MNLICVQKYFLVIFLIIKFGSGSEEEDLKWNELKFTQEWGFAACKKFLKENGGKVKCRYEDRPSIWSIHGIWPTKIGTGGPNFCTKVKFNPQSLQPIEDQLNQFWYEISDVKDPNNFWSHEWVKHGSCAAELAEFDTELKYFEMGLNLRNKYDLHSILSQGGIIPTKTKGYHMNEIKASIHNALGVTPIIQCYQSKENGIHSNYLLSVEICMDRTLKPIDCSTHSIDILARTGVDGSDGNCPNDKEILYYDNIPQTNHKEL